MNTIALLFTVQCLFVSIRCLQNHGVATLNYSLEEEGQSGVFIANIPQDSKLIANLTSPDVAEFDFSFASYGQSITSLFLLNRRTGVLKTARRVDREALCTRQEKCAVKADVSVYIRKVVADQRELFVIVPVNIFIEDKNDHAPVFPDDEMELLLPESVAINYTLLISGAIDEDSTTNSVALYKLTPANEHFTIYEVRNLDGTTDIGIVVTQPLDYETVHSHSLRIVAVDGGNPPRSGTVRIKINVLDVNDVRPVFTNTSYKVFVPENRSIGSIVIQLMATDADSGDNGRLTYQFSTRVPSTIRSVLAVNETTGAVYITGELDYEQNSAYSFLVQVKDNGLHSLTSRALVEVIVTDVNDHTPSVNLKLPDNLHRITVSEITTPNSFITEMTVVDLDAADNGRVDCVSKNDNFKLVNYYNNLYKILLNHMLDYERASRESVTIVCSDNGKPPLTSNVTFIVIIEDENDNWPVFSDKNFDVQIMENNNIGDTILQLSALDLDSGDNGRIMYSIDQTWASTFSVNPTTGRIIASRILDHEDISEFRFQATATDGGKNRLSSNVSVSIKILDANDNSPMFDQSEYAFHVSETSPGGVTVGKILISDADSGKNGESNILLKEEGEYFRQYLHMNYNTGEIILHKPIDRENIPEINLTLLVSDNGSPVLTNFAEVSIVVDDENDNAPVIVFPSSDNSSVSVTHNGEEDEYVTRIIAFDRDDGNNAKLMYDIAEDNSGLFEIEVDTGIVWAKRPIYENDIGTHHLKIAVSDHGLPAFSTEAYLDIVLAMSNSSYSSGLLSGTTNEGSNINLIIVVVIVSSTFVFSFAILLTIFVIRKIDRSRIEKPKMTLTLTDRADKFDFSMGIETQSPKPMASDSYLVDDEIVRKKMVTFAFSKDEQDRPGILQDDIRAFEYQHKDTFDKKMDYPSHVDDSHSIISENSTNDSGRGNSEHGIEEDSAISSNGKGNSSMSSSNDLPFVRYKSSNESSRGSFRCNTRPDWSQLRRDTCLRKSVDVLYDNRFLPRATQFNQTHNIVTGIRQGCVLQDDYLTKELFSYEGMQSQA